MIYFTVHGWFFWQNPKGELELLVKGSTVETMSCMFPAEDPPTVHPNRSSVDKVLGSLREQLPELLRQAAIDRKIWMTERDRERIIS